MMRTTIILIVLGCLSLQPASASSHATVLTWGGPINDRIYEIDSDADGNIYVLGSVNGDEEVDFDPGPGVDIRLPGDMFLSKFDENGDYVWSLSWEGNFPHSGSLVCDPAGNVYVGGTSWDEFDLDPGEGVDTTVALDSGSVHYLLKLDTDGSFIWGKSLEFSVSDIDCGESLLLTGRTSSGDDSKIIVCRMSTSGRTEWEHIFAGEDGSPDDIAYDIGLEVEDMGTGYYLAGVFTGTENLDPGEGSMEFTASEGADMFLGLYNDDGSAVWINTWPTTFPVAGVRDMAVGEGNCCYICGTNMHYPRTSAFLKKINSNGEIQWEHEWVPIDAPGACFSNSIASDSLGVIYLGGYLMHATVELDPCGNNVLETAERGNGFALFLRGDNSCMIDGYIPDGSGVSDVDDILAREDGRVVIGGNFSEEMNLNSDDHTEMSVSNGMNDCFLVILRLGMDSE